MNKSMSLSDIEDNVGNVAEHNASQPAQRGIFWKSQIWSISQ